MSAAVKRIALFLLCLAQLGAASWSIARYESTLSSGARYKIRTGVIDPADAFRGRYVAVQPTMTMEAPLDPAAVEILQSVSGSGTAYAVLATDAEGFATPARIVSSPPADGDYLEIAQAWPRWSRETQPDGRQDITGFNIVFGFDRYYMNETAAPLAQDRYFAAVRRNSGSRAWLNVRVKNGLGVIEGLFIDDVAIETLLSGSKSGS